MKELNFDNKIDLRVQADPRYPDAESTLIRFVEVIDLVQKYPVNPISLLPSPDRRSWYKPVDPNMKMRQFLSEEVK